MAMSEDGETWEVRGQVLETEWQDLLVDLRWRMREAGMTLLFGASSCTLNLFATLASKVVTFQSVAPEARPFAPEETGVFYKPPSEKLPPPRLSLGSH